MNPNIARLVRQTIYSLKTRYGSPVTLYRLVDSSTNYQSGERSNDVTSVSVRNCIILPEVLSRELFQGVSYLAASRSFASLGAQWQEGVRGFIFDSIDLREFIPNLSDWIVADGQRFNIESIESLKAGFLIVGKAVRGDG